MWPFKRNDSSDSNSAPAPRARKIRGTDSGEKQLAQALNLIFNFTNGVSVDPPDLEVRDERELPAPKAVMVEAFRMVLTIEKRPDWRNAFYDAGLKLAYFWPDIGAERLRLPDGLFPHPAAATGAARPGATDKRQSKAKIEAFSAAFARVGPEHDRIAEIFDAAIGTMSTTLEQEVRNAARRPLSRIV